MVKSGLLQSRGLDIVECDVDGKLYGWTKSDIVELMKVRDKNPYDEYYVVDIESVKVYNVYTMYTSSSRGSKYNSNRTFRVWFMMVKDSSDGVLTVSKRTSMDIDDMVVRMREMKLDKVLMDSQS